MARQRILKALDLAVEVLFWVILIMAAIIAFRVITGVVDIDHVDHAGRELVELAFAGITTWAVGVVLAIFVQE